MKVKRVSFQSKKYDIKKCCIAVKKGFIIIFASKGSIERATVNLKALLQINTVCSEDYRSFQYKFIQSKRK